MERSDAIKNDPVCMPEDVIVLSKWGDGNYFLEDRQTGDTIKLAPSMYWNIVERAQDLIGCISLNGGGADK